MKKQIVETKSFKTLSEHKSRDLTGTLAKIGINALVDEATGFQCVRPQDVLVKIFVAQLSEDNKSLAPWLSRIPIDFWTNMFRLLGTKMNRDTLANRLEAPHPE